MPRVCTPLKIVRQRSGLLQCDVAAMLGFSVATYNLVENGRRPLSDKDTAKVARILKVPVSKLTADDEA